MISIGRLSAQGVLRARDAEAHGFARTVLARLVQSGELERVGRGLYVPAKAKITEHHSLVEGAVRVPHGVVCLLSALRFHGMGTQNPHEVWLAIDVKAWKPVADSPPLRIVRFSGAALIYGIEVHKLEGVDVRITSREKTVADCFKYRNKIGLDVALEALREYLRSRKRSIDQLTKAAEACRVARVMRPYLEALG
jgi:predicted transcriptional regulator of viral defense system